MKLLLVFGSIIENEMIHTSFHQFTPSFQSFFAPNRPIKFERNINLCVVLLRMDGWDGITL